MKEIVYDVVVGAIILSILLVAIDMYRGGSQAIQNTAEKDEVSSKIRTMTLVGDGAKVRGTDVLASIDYFAFGDNTEAIEVQVNALGVGGVPDDTFSKNEDYEDMKNVRNEYSEEPSFLDAIFTEKHEDSNNDGNPEKIIYNKN